MSPKRRYVVQGKPAVPTAIHRNLTPPQSSFRMTPCLGLGLIFVGRNSLFMPRCCCATTHGPKQSSTLHASGTRRGRPVVRARFASRAARIF